jgi:hypothetical protein
MASYRECPDKFQVVQDPFEQVRVCLEASDGLFPLPVTVKLVALKIR